jgi:ubiquinone biosynthesis protein UbiJ
MASRAAIMSSGLFGNAPADRAAAAVVRFRPGGPPEVIGEEPLAAALGFVLKHLAWDAEEDLSRLVGDVAAHRLVHAGRDLLAWQRDAARRLAESGAEYLAGQNGPLVARQELAQMRAALDDLDARIEELARRVARVG